jgi:hypothetical protein
VITLIEKARRPAAKADGYEIRNKRLAAIAQTARYLPNLGLNIRLSILEGPISSPFPSSVI